jgi:hypothetical protein
MYESRDLIIIMYDASRLEQCVVESMLIIRLGKCVCTLRVCVIR